MHHEEPAANSLLNSVHGIACNCLLNLSQQCLGITDEEIANVLASLEFHSQNVTWNAKQAALKLHETSVKGGAAVHGREETERTFAPDIGRLDRRTVFQNRQQGEDGAIGEISVFEKAARLAHDVAKLNFDSLKIPKDPLAGGASKFSQYPILRRQKLQIAFHSRFNSQNG